MENQLNKKQIEENKTKFIKLFLKRIQQNLSLNYEIQNLQFKVQNIMKHQFKKILSYLNHIDNKVSGRIHQLDNVIVSCLLYPFAAFFHPGLIWIAFITIYFFSNYNLNFLIIYVVGVLLCLLTIYLLKRTLKRQRPLLVTTAKKPHHFRKKEKNHAMPSGDAIQSALFVVFLHYWEVPIGYLIVFHIGVCLGRVYYMCHWIADTVVASILGAGIAWYFLGAYQELNLNEMIAFQL